MGATASLPLTGRGAGAPPAFTKATACLDEPTRLVPAADAEVAAVMAEVESVLAEDEAGAALPEARPSFDGAPQRAVPRTAAAPPTDCFLDSRLVRGVLSPAAADALLSALRAVPATRRPRPGGRYSLRTDYYGAPRRGDGAVALDRWGGDHEAWARVAPLPACLGAARDAVAALACRGSFGDAPPALAHVANSVAVNYYDGDSEAIAAHQDSTASLVADSAIYCLTLGATRDVVLCGLDDAGKTEALAAPIATFAPRHGDVFVLGPKTNATCCHGVPRAEPETGDRLRVSIVFRSVDKTFVRAAPPRTVAYASGATRTFAAEAVTVDAPGREDVAHLADLVAAREARKAARKARAADAGAAFYLDSRPSPD